MNSFTSFLAAAAIAALSLAPMVTSMPVAANVIVPPIEHYGSIDYRTGGIGVHQAAAMEQEARRYPLTLEFLEQAGNRREYSADENVQILDAHGRQIFTATTAGPFMLVDLPNGKYKVTATNHGYAQVRHIVLTGKQHDRVSFDWPAKELEPHLQ